MSKAKYLAIQMFLLVVPPVLAALFLHLNPYTKNPVEAVVEYSAGITGYAVWFAIMYFSGLSESASAGPFLAAYLVIAVLIFNFTYEKAGRVNAIMIAVNTALSIQSVIFGAIVMGMGRF